MQEKKFIPNGENDREKLLSAMETIGELCFQPVDEEAFEDRELALAFNKMLQSIVDGNNRVLLRINDAQIRIADNTSVKKMIEQIKSQEEPLDNLKESSAYLRSMTQQNETKQIEMIALVKQADSTLKPLLARVKSEMEALQESSQNVQRALLEWLPQQLSEVNELVEMLKIISLDLYYQDTIKADFFDNYDECLEFLLASYNGLLDSCFQNGSRLYRISRDIDNARNDMYRTNSNVTLIDCTKIFAVDHLTLVWRLYNNIIEYEHLKITQINNPDRCKFGLWCANMDNPIIKDAEEFKAAMEGHEMLHEHAVACYVAKEASETQRAMEEFELSLQACKIFTDSLENLAEFMRQHGYSEETEVYQFK